jgi:MFS family permease
MIALFAIGIIVGRVACGIALDYFSASYVSAITMALPALGMFLIASAFDSHPVLACAILMLGLSYGAEGDVISSLVARIFNLKIYGTVLGLLVAALSLGSMAGALLLSLTLQFGDSYDTFLVLAGILALIGSLLFLLLPNHQLPETKADIGPERAPVSPG